ncbi:MAG TPA: hypothetical protein PKA42_03740 [Candidatus Paceibacterota bacterium]|nr:hypothetical protein [Candidatus Paceibacterota bacterium]HMO83251.1 hypothetical protein [Candidatus Paceibacterota bacterium]
MFQKSDIETILKINGVSQAAAPEAIRLVLKRASYNEQEIEAALSLLQNNTTNLYNKNTELNKIFRTTEALKPSEISSLLGIEVQVACVPGYNSKDRNLSWLQTLVVIFLAIILAVIGIVAAMYIYEVGIFHPTVTAFGGSK